MTDDLLKMQRKVARLETDLKELSEAFTQSSTQAEMAMEHMIEHLCTNSINLIASTEALHEDLISRLGVLWKAFLLETPEERRASIWARAQMELEMLPPVLKLAEKHQKILKERLNKAQKE